MDAQIAISPWLLAAIGTVMVIGSGAIYSRVVRQILATGGKVDTGKLSARDAGLATALAGLLVLLGAASFLLPSQPIQVSSIVSGSFNFLFLLALIVGILLWRGVNLFEFFGLRRVGFFAAIAIGIGLLFAAYPIILGTSILVQTALGEDAQPQELVKFFVGIAEAGKHSKIVIVLLFAGIFGPAAEELIFRGYFYPVFKRYLGLWPAVFLSAALFAFIHANLAALPALFLLAVCLALAYERTGSLVVPYVMHATFNLFSLVALLFATFTPK